MDFMCDIIVLSECWLSKTSYIPNNDGYISHSTGFHNQNDGIVVYTRTGMLCDVSEPEFLDGNCLVIKIGRELAVVELYRSPSFKKWKTFLSASATHFQTCHIIK